MLKKKSILFSIIFASLVNACGVQSNLVIPMNTATTNQTSAPVQSLSPTAEPTTNPTSIPTGFPSLPPVPSLSPTAEPTTNPTSIPTGFPSLPPAPSLSPTAAPTANPTSIPTGFPSLPPAPSLSPTTAPTANPTSIPTGFPSLPPAPTPTLTPVPPSPTPTSTPTPVIPIYKIIGSSSVSIGNSYWNKPIIKIDATLVGDRFEVTVSKIDGTSFTTASDVFLKVGTYESYGVNHVVSRIIPGERSIKLTDNIGRYNWSETTKKFYVRLQDSAGSWSWSGAITVSKY